MAIPPAQEPHSLAATGLKPSQLPPVQAEQPLTMLSVALSQGLRLRYFLWRSYKETIQDFEAQRVDLGFAKHGRSCVLQQSPICHHMDTDLINLFICF